VKERALTESYKAFSLDEITAQFNELGCLLRKFLTREVRKNLLAGVLKSQIQ